MENTVLDVQGLTKSVGHRTLLDDISFSVPERWRVGLIARNGTGKSTLLNILCDNEPYDEGLITFRSDLRVAYLKQHPTFLPTLTAEEACFEHGGPTAELVGRYNRCLVEKNDTLLTELTEQMDQMNAWDFENRVKQILSMLHIPNTRTPMQKLSGGELKRVALANALLREPDFLVMDEPTNHLDLDMIEWLERYLQNAGITLLMVTHDRFFLDRVCNEILELDNEKIYTYHGNFPYYLEKRQERIDARNAEIARMGNLYRKELEWMRRMPQARGHKARYREEAFKEIERVAKLRTEEQRLKLDVKSTYIGNKILELNYVSKCFGKDKVILKDFFYTFQRYEKVGIVGNNGTGKTTFLKLMMGLLKPDSGSVSVGQTVRFGYYSQEGLKLEEGRKVIDTMRDIAEVVDLGDGRKLTAGQLLQLFLFTPEQQYNEVDRLSGGERRRLFLCMVLMRSPNFLILDEPTNDFDIVTLQVLEEYLRGFRGCVVVVSHDRYFMDKVVDHLFVFTGGGQVKDFPGNYSQYREWAELQPLNESNEKVPAPPTTRVRTQSHARLSFKEQKELEALTTDIEGLEQEKHDLEAAFAGGKLTVEEVTAKSRRLPQLEKELNEKSDRWLELSMKTE